MKSIQYKFKKEISKLKILDVSETDADGNETEIDKSKNNVYETILIDNNLNHDEDDQKEQQQLLLHVLNNHEDNEHILTEYMLSNKNYDIIENSNDIITNKVIETDKINEYNDDNNGADGKLLCNDKSNNQYLKYTDNIKENNIEYLKHSSDDSIKNQNVDFICETNENTSIIVDQSMNSIIENLELNEENNIYDECNEKLFDSVNNNCSIIEEYLTLPIIASTTDDNHLIKNENSIEFSTECNTNEVNLNFNFSKYNNYYNNNNIIVKRIRRKYKLKCRQCNNLRSLKCQENKIKQNVYRLIQQTELLIQTKNQLLDEVNALQTQKILLHTKY